MDVKLERLDVCEGVFKTEPHVICGPTLSIKQEYKNENDDNDLFDGIETNTLLPEQNDYLIEQVIKCEELKTEFSDLQPKIHKDSLTDLNEPFLNVITKTDLHNITEVISTNVPDTQIDNIYVQSKSELEEISEVTAPVIEGIQDNICKYVECKAEMIPTIEYTDYPDYVAESCDKDQDQNLLDDFPVSNSRKNHLEDKKFLTIHTNGKSFKCNICSKEFAIKSTLKEHSVIHTKETPFKCNVCAKEFGWRSSLRQHLLSHTNEKSFKCNMCSKAFNKKCILKQHLLTHTDGKPFKCNICSKEFTQKRNMQKHLIYHTNEMPFKCNICSKGFAQKFNLKEHSVVHTKETPFKCNDCSKEFSWKSTLRQHVCALE